ncbi:MAG TPA: aldehyde dehydrogenase family protein [Acidimicrobiales bacterium]|nr:aldehyde dehydrogenase family protein [Acidimicrobiales bacterium]
MADQVTKDETQLLIGGKWVAAGNGTYEIINPATEQVVGVAPNASVEDANQAAAAAAEAFPAWSNTPVDERLALLKQAAAAIRAKNDELVPLVIAETGATASVGSRMQVPISADRFERYSRDIRHVQESMLPPVTTAATPLAPGGLVSALAYRQPVGVVAAIASYNFPLTNMAGKVAPALAMGNTVVIKPAPQDPLAVVELVRVLDEVGFPPGVINLISSQGPEPAAALTSSPDVDMVSFTGSTAVGQRIAAAGAPSMKRLLMELGGKGAAVVFADADIKAAVGAIGSTWAFHSGQICTAPTRAVIHRSIFDQVVEELSKFAGFLTVGDPTETKTVVGPLISASQQQRVLDYIETGRKEGEVVTGGNRPGHLPTGYYVESTLICGTNDITVAREEIFGPVVVAIPFDDDDEGVAIANDSEFGLYDYVFSADTPRAFRVAKQLRCGHVGINTAQRNMDAPFGGFKMSGIGRDGGDYGLEAYSEMQSIIWAG